MMFGGGDKGGDKEGEGNFLDKLKKAQEMFSPEMMQKYQMVGQKLEQVKTELAATEVACELDEGVTVVFSGRLDTLRFRMVDCTYEGWAQ